MLCLNRVVVLGEARIGNSFESGAGQDVSSAWPIRLFPSVLWLARLAFWEKRKQQRNVVTMHSLKVRSSNCVLSLIGFCGFFYCLFLSFLLCGYEMMSDEEARRTCWFSFSYGNHSFTLHANNHWSVGPSVEVTYHLQEVLYFARFRGGAEWLTSRWWGLRTLQQSTLALLGHWTQVRSPNLISSRWIFLEWFRMGWGGQSSKDAMVICHNLSRIQSIQSQLSIFASLQLTSPERVGALSGSGALQQLCKRPSIHWLKVSHLGSHDFSNETPTCTVKVWDFSKDPYTAKRTQRPKAFFHRLVSLQRI